jgi:hypothetical protein
MDTKTIEIDTETNALLEARRKSFSETPNEIIKRSLNEFGCQDTNHKGETMIAAQPKQAARRSRASGSYGYSLLGVRNIESSLRSAYISILRGLQARDSGFLARLSCEETPGRRLVAKNPMDLYKRTPKLADSYAEKLDTDWYVDVNLSELQVVQRLKIACKIAGIEYGEDLRVDFD